jgi:hypothetical protein
MAQTLAAGAESYSLSGERQLRTIRRVAWLRSLLANPIAGWCRSWRRS